MAAKDAGALTRWFALTSSNIWEAVLMFCVYISIRWFPSLRSTAVFLQVYVLAVLAREAIVDYGRVFVRLTWWLWFASNDGHLKVPWSCVHTSAAELTGFFLMAIIVPLFPLYILGLCAFAIHAFLSRRAKMGKRRSLGANLYFCVILPILRYKPPRRRRRHGSVSVSISTSATGNVNGNGNTNTNSNSFVKVFSHFASSTAPDYSSAEEDGNLANSNGNGNSNSRYYSSGEETELEVSTSNTKRLRHSRSKRLQTIIIILFNCVLLRLLGDYMHPYVTPYVYPAKLFLETILFSLVLVCISLSIVFIGGTHVTIVFALSLEVIMVLKHVELETIRHELIVWGCFLVPICIQINTWIFKKIIDEALDTLRYENGHESRRTQLALVYHAIPVDAVEATHKMWDSCVLSNNNVGNTTTTTYNNDNNNANAFGNRKKGERPAERISSRKNATFVIELDRNVTIQDFRVALIERDEKRWNGDIV